VIVRVDSPGETAEGRPDLLAMYPAVARRTTAATAAIAAIRRLRTTSDQYPGRIASYSRRSGAFSSLPLSCPAFSATGVGLPS
jgi:hypothetical protein